MRHAHAFAAASLLALCAVPAAAQSPPPPRDPMSLSCDEIAGELSAAFSSPEMMASLAELAEGEQKLESATGRMRDQQRRSAAASAAANTAANVAGAAGVIAGVPGIEAMVGLAVRAQAEGQAREAAKLGAEAAGAVGAIAPAATALMGEGRLLALQAAIEAKGCGG